MTRLQPFSRNIEDYPQGIVLPVDKPYRWTSADVVRRIKWAACRHFRKRNLKVGHAGTLDPLATGILLICIGSATKRADELQKSPKQYVAGVTFGATTPSFDLEKEIDRTCPVDGVSEDSVRSVLPSFTGEISQVAPLFSAKSVDGVRVYETARRLFREAQREGRDFDPGELLHASKVVIYDMELLSFGPYRDADVTPSDNTASRIHVADIKGCNLPTATIRVECSKGTYIRSLARDLGEALGSGAFLSSLRRTSNGGYQISDAISVPEALSLLAADQSTIPAQTDTLSECLVPNCGISTQ